MYNISKLDSNCFLIEVDIFFYISPNHYHGGQDLLPNLICYLSFFVHLEKHYPIVKITPPPTFPRCPPQIHHMDGQPRSS